MNQIFQQPDASAPAPTLPDTLLHVVLYRPEIPPNTGNIQRICAATGAMLHLVGPIAFRLDNAALKRAGMDYRQWVDVQRYDDWAHCLRMQPLGVRWIPISTKATQGYHTMRYQAGDRLLFGSEGSGLPAEIHQALGHNAVRVPMLPRARSLNLANTVAVVLYEALRQLNYPEMA
ncbi:tRNA/rRNA methyltransferase (SpoU) [Magnetococcus marinus MC-1]|uniref:tRNA (cytidine(34)-2'-O)-methyltransferase n=1 Tax=Magnetococcus marinus (strain ATCC BAA-1437 / JCM 17883 / MC-1) TaxID=156889 RepID=A0L4J2_MAGMM|nr:tRNA (cytidine(34)-2'-O)-methyltransferase [Magnetococcus marinus]ABK42885.1 tRNA/rRNA methyltransferase (SpoU) [Magnetococcus marinus MC-1]